MWPKKSLQNQGLSAVSIKRPQEDFVLTQFCPSIRPPLDQRLIEFMMMIFT